LTTFNLNIVLLVCLRLWVCIFFGAAFVLKMALGTMPAAGIEPGSPQRCRRKLTRGEEAT
jgi:hypothetical protein